MLKKPLSVLLLVTVGLPSIAQANFCSDIMNGRQPLLLPATEMEIIPDQRDPFHDHQFQTNLEYLNEQATKSFELLLNAVGPKHLVPDAHPGSIMASPSTYIPGVPSQNYRYYWKRDGALVMREAYYQWAAAIAKGDQKRAEELLKRILDWVDFCRILHSLDNESGKAFAEGVNDPKFNLNATPFHDQWVRPQNDGPALEAVTQMLIATKLIEIGRMDLVRERFYDADPARHAAIQVNMQVVRNSLLKKTGNVWEDKRGFHLYNHLSHLDAMDKFAAFLDLLGDYDGAKSIRATADQVRPAADRFYDSNYGYLRATIDPEPGTDPKSSLDAEAILAVIHSGPVTGALSPLDDRVLQTMHSWVMSFANLYEINKLKKSATGEDLGIAVGRYQEDKFNGYTTDASTQGNPWFLTTLAAAEFHFRFEYSLKKAGSIRVTERNLEWLRALGLARAPVVGQEIKSGTAEFKDLIQANRRRAAGYIQRVKYHAGPDGHLSEEFNRDTGYMQGVEDLTWSHAAVLSLTRSIEQLGSGALQFLKIMSGFVR
jgi:glucoamylase